VCVYFLKHSREKLQTNEQEAAANRVVDFDREEEEDLFVLLLLPCLCCDIVVLFSS